MTNHGRTLLANQKASNGDFLAYAAEEFTPDSFVPVELTPELGRLRALLFGIDPDRDFINYRCRQLLSIVHQTPWVGYLEELDSRFTYRVGDADELVPRSRFAAVATQISGSGPTVLPLFGFPAAPDFNGRSRIQYQVAVLTSNSVRVTRLSAPASSTIYPITIISGLSNLVPLVSSGYNFRLVDNTTDLAWVVDITLRPQWDVSTLIADAADTLTTDLDILLAGPEPYQTFRNLWGQKELPGRVAGLILGLIYRTNELWRATRAAG